MFILSLVCLYLMYRLVCEIKTFDDILKGKTK